MHTKGHIPCQVACAKGLVACYISPSTHNMGKTCMKTWTQNMSRNAKVKKKWGKTWADWGKKNCSNTLILTALTTNYGHM